MGWTGTRQFYALAVATLNVPLYQGGSEYASIRKAKEQLGQARLRADVPRDNVRRSVVFAYAQLQASKAVDCLKPGGGRGVGKIARGCA